MGNITPHTNPHLSPDRHAIDFTTPIDTASVVGQTILITGGASGFGASFAQRWAAAGAHIIIADVNTTAGDALARDLCRTTPSQHHHFVHCDVTRWQSQVDLFHEAIRLSPHGRIDHVVASAGVSASRAFDEPAGLDVREPPPPDLRSVEVNLLGTLYTAHLAIFYLQQDAPTPTVSTSTPTPPRDRHLLLIGSVASLLPFPAQTLYAVSKHGVLALFRAQRLSAAYHGIRVNLLCPYFVETSIIDTTGRFFLSGIPKAELSDVLDAATRLVADDTLSGRCLVIAPGVEAGDAAKGLERLKSAREAQGPIWEVFEEDLENSEPFQRRLIGLLNTVSAARGWVKYLRDLRRAVWSMLGL